MADNFHFLRVGSYSSMVKGATHSMDLKAYITWLYLLCFLMVVVGHLSHQYVDSMTCMILVGYGMIGMAIIMGTYYIQDVVS